jgi:hypothetical protein
MAVIGEPVVARLRCLAQSDSPDALTFEHRSLVIELEKEGLPEASLAFPNRFAAERGGNLLRLSSSGGIEALRAGEERVRTFDLTRAFPEEVLSTGIISVTYRLEEAVPVVRTSPGLVDVWSGPEAVHLLLRLLEDEDLAVRSRAAEVLGLMTSRNFGYHADGSSEARVPAVRQWKTWWDSEGSQLPWNFESEGATFGEVPARAPVGLRSSKTGGIAYPRIS